MLVDPAATYTWVPTDILEGLGAQPEEDWPFVLAAGREVALRSSRKSTAMARHRPGMLTAERHSGHAPRARSSYIPTLEPPKDCPAMPELLERITVNPQQCGGRPCIRGMRIRVVDILDMLAAGMTREEILADYPDLEADDITAALQYARRRLDHPVVAA